MNLHKVIGLMSGTSLDGLDICYCEFRKEDNWNFKILNTSTISYNNEWREKLKNSINYSEDELNKLDKELGILWGKWVGDFIKENNLTVDFISSHGHTVLHQPEKGITLQIGSAEEIINQTQLIVISDFRSKDVKLGGQGAPLVPIGDKFLFTQYNYCLNLGGISNVSFDDDKGYRRAYDISLCNLVLNHYANQLGMEYDKNGEGAKNGKLHMELYNKLQELNYYTKVPPKSLGRENMETEVLPIIDSFDLSIEDKLRTFTEHIGYQIGKVLMKGNTLVTGGGAFNRFLIDCINKNSNSTIIPGDPLLISFKEALVFGFLGVLRYRDEINVMKSYTGATKDTCSGIITSIV